MEKKQQQKLYEMAPILAFVAGVFVFELFNWHHITSVVWAVWLSAATYMFLAADVKMEHKGKADFSRLNFFSGLLTLEALLILMPGILEWTGTYHKNTRLIVLLAILLVFFISLFRAVRVLMEIKRTIENKG